MTGLVQSTKHFKAWELRCKCGCGYTGMDATFMKSLEELRVQFGLPMTLTSAYRCPSYNQSVSHTGLNGPHTTMRAVDIAIGYLDAYRLIQLAFSSHKFTGIGINQKGDKRFIHLDDLNDNPGCARPRAWTY